MVRRPEATRRQALLRLGLLVILCGAACDAPPPDDAGTADSARAVAAPPEAGSSAAGPAMAVTIDDLPWSGARSPGHSRMDALRSLVEKLNERDVPAVGFANCNRIGSGAPALNMWVDAGLELGNHTARHRDLNDAPLAQWLNDVRSCHDVVREISGRDTIWFRYPYLHQGPTVERQAAALATLEELASPVAHVTIDNSDWILAVAYGEAVTRGDSARAAAIGDAFVDHIIRATQHYQEVAREKTGRDVRHVLLLHASLLVADHIGTLLDRLRTEHGFDFISLAAAQQDPAYDRADGYTGEDGVSFLYRMEPATPDMAAWDDAEARRLREEWR